MVTIESLLYFKKILYHILKQFKVVGSHSAQPKFEIKIKLKSQRNQL